MGLTPSSVNKLSCVVREKSATCLLGFYSQQVAVREEILLTRLPSSDLVIDCGEIRHCDDVLGLIQSCMSIAHEEDYIRGFESPTVKIRVLCCRIPILVKDGDDPRELLKKYRKDRKVYRKGGRRVQFTASSRLTFTPAGRKPKPKFRNDKTKTILPNPVVIS